MLLQSKVQRILDDTSLELNIGIDVIDLNATVIASTTKENIGISEQALLEHFRSMRKSIAYFSGKTISLISYEGKPALLTVIEGTGRAAVNTCVLASRLIEAKLALSHKRQTREETLRKLLNGQIADFDAEAILMEHKVAIKKNCCVYSLRTPDNYGFKVFDMLNKAFQKDTNDYLVHIDSNTIALIKIITDDFEHEDLFQLADAIFETIYSEMSLKLKFGLGSIRPSLLGARESYIESQKALEVGLLHNPNLYVHHFDKLLLERLVNKIPQVLYDSYLKCIWNDEFQKLFTPEIQVTVEKFYDNNLNLSEAARQLYIHRNTLVYRLEKIEKATGLDIRNFHDAVTLRVLMMLKKQVQERTIDTV